MTRRNMRGEEQVTVQGPVKEQQPDGMTHRELPRGLGHNVLKQFSNLYKSKMEYFAKHFFDIVTTYNDGICYVKHVLDPLCVFFTLFGWGGGVPRGSWTRRSWRMPTCVGSTWEPLGRTTRGGTSGRSWGQPCPTPHPCRLRSGARWSRSPPTSPRPWPRW